MNYIKQLPATPGHKNDPAQASLDLRIDRESEFDGIGMGVLSDGTPFLNQRGLARMCGVQNAHIGTISSDWSDEQKPRIQSIKKILTERGVTMSSPHIELTRGGRLMYCYPEAVCMAVLEYYAFDAGTNIQPEAQKRFRWLAGRSLRDIIYTQLGYKPRSEFAEIWQQFHDRVSLVYDSVPPGYFCIFKEIADLMVTLINAGAPVGTKFIPDISVGKAWAAHWVKLDFASRHGERLTYEHNYPNYFPQAASNPQTPYCYPETALHEFRKWMRETYLPNGFPAYLGKKVKDGKIPLAVTKVAMAALETKRHVRPIIKS